MNSRSKKCPLCGSDLTPEGKCKRFPADSDVDSTFYEHITCFTYDVKVNISERMLNETEEPVKEKLLNLLVEKIIREKKSPNGTFWSFYYDPEESETKISTPNPRKINLKYALDGYPNTIEDYMDRILLNLSILHPVYGEKFCVQDSVAGCRTRVFFKKPFADISGTLNMLSDFGYIKRNQDPEKNFKNMISVDGWKRIENIRKGIVVANQGFIAMKFDKEDKQLESIRKAIIAGIEGAGYQYIIMDEEEHNNQIVPEILYKIRQSKFLVLDATYGNLGAYYEAGYATALNKEVIICCKKDVLDGKCGDLPSPHFDIAQQKMVVWTDEEDLKKKLSARIISTVS